MKKPVTKMIRRLTLLSFLICFAVFFAACGSGNTDSNLTYELSPNGQYYIVTGVGESSRTASGKTSTILIPEEYEGLPVQEIKAEAFSGYTNIKGVSIPNSIAFIGKNAFNNCPLEFNEYEGGEYLGNENNPYLFLWSTTETQISSFTLHQDTKLIGDMAFYGATFSEDLRYGNAYYIGTEENAHMVLVKAANSSISTCTVHSDTKIIQSSAFESCRSLTNVILSDKVTTIGARAFYQCDRLESVQVGESVAYIDHNAFGNCSSLKNILLTDSLKRIEEAAFYGSACRDITIAALKEHWNAVIKGNRWAPTGQCTVHCIDGDITV